MSIDPLSTSVRISWLLPTLCSTGVQRFRRLLVSAAKTRSYTSLNSVLRDMRSRKTKNMQHTHDAVVCGAIKKVYLDKLQKRTIELLLVKALWFCFRHTSGRRAHNIPAGHSN